MPLAVRLPAVRPEATAVVPVGSLLMLYTDGLVERRRESLDDGIDRATSVAHGARDADLADLAATLMGRLRPADGYEDDVALLLYRRSVPPLELDFPAHPDNLASTRHWLRAWLGTFALDEDFAQDVLVAAGEACANAVEHAYPGEDGTAHLSARLTGRAPGRHRDRPRPLEAATAGQPPTARPRHADDGGAGRRGRASGTTSTAPPSRWNGDSVRDVGTHAGRLGGRRRSPDPDRDRRDRPEQRRGLRHGPGPRAGGRCRAHRGLHRGDLPRQRRASPPCSTGPRRTTCGWWRPRLLERVLRVSGLPEVPKW